MAKSEGTTEPVPESLATQIRAAVEAGEYASTSDAVSDAVRQWSNRRPPGTAHTDSLRQAWDTGKASSAHGPIDFNDLRQEARARIADITSSPARAG